MNKVLNYLSLALVAALLGVSSIHAMEKSEKPQEPRNNMILKSVLLKAPFPSPVSEDFKTQQKNLVKKLILGGADPNLGQTDDEYNTTLQLALMEYPEDAEFAQFLLERGADPNQKIPMSTTDPTLSPILEVALRNGAVPLVIELIKYGAEQDENFERVLWRVKGITQQQRDQILAASPLEKGQLEKKGIPQTQKTVRTQEAISSQYDKQLVDLLTQYKDLRGIGQLSPALYGKLKTSIQKAIENGAQSTTELTVTAGPSSFTFTALNMAIQEEDQAFSNWLMDKQ